VNLSDESKSTLMAPARIVLGLLFVLASLHAADIEFITQELPWAVLRKGYSPPPLETRSSGACPLGGISYAVVSGELPPGLQLSRLGYLSGTPLEPGSFEIAVRVSNGCSWTAKHFILTVTEAPVLSADTPRLLLETKSALEAKSAEEQTVKLSSTWPRLAYQVASNSDWLTATPAQGFLPDSLRVNAATRSLKPGRYQGEITVSAWQALAALRIMVVLTVTD
jgi:BACON domain-containing protein/putative Ig domain-containing protein